MTDRPPVAYKILTANEHAVLTRDRVFAGSADDLRDGFIHLSTADQLAATLDRHYAARHDLVIAAVDVDALGDAIRWEPSRGGALFPHLYAPLNLDDVIAYGPVDRDAGNVRLPVAG